LEKLKLRKKLAKKRGFKAKKKTKQKKLATFASFFVFFSFFFPPSNITPQKKKKDHHPKSSTKLEYFEYPEKEWKKKVEKKLEIKKTLLFLDIKRVL